MHARRILTSGCLAATLTTAALAAGSPSAHASVRAQTHAAAYTAPAGIQAPHAEVANAVTGAVIWNHGATAQVPMGSLTKVMTAYVVIKSGNLDRLITVPSGITAYDNKYGASTAGLRPGEKLTARQLLYAMLVPSGCDAAYTLARAYGPGISAFIGKMNKAAASLRLTGTHFTDPSGLPDPTETSTYSTAAALVTLGRAAMALPLFASIVRTRSYYLAAASGEHPAFTWKTTNPLLLASYPGTVGIKTGYTRAAGDCLLFQADRGGKDVIGVALDDPSMKAATNDAEALLNYGFANY